MVTADAVPKTGVPISHVSYVERTEENALAWHRRHNHRSTQLYCFKSQEHSWCDVEKTQEPPESGDRDKKL
jgi:hypothetical protein